MDYAHHPTEIKNTLQTAKKIYRKVVFIFQPHTYSRTKELLKDFIEIFKDEENLIFYKTFPAREKKEAGLSSKELASILERKYFDDVDELVEFIKAEHSNFTPVFIGAGDLPKLLEDKKYIEKL